MRNCQYSDSYSEQRTPAAFVRKLRGLLPRTRTDSHEHDTRYHQYASSEHEKPRASGIEDGTDKDAA
jgi:hypothetical protein